MDEEEVVKLIADQLKCFRTYMGEEFSTLPFPIKEELEKSISNRASRIARLHEMKAPAVCIEFEQHALEERMSMYKNGEYVVSPSEEDYRNRFIERADKFVYPGEYFDYTVHFVI